MAWVANEVVSCEAKKESSTVCSSMHGTIKNNHNYTIQIIYIFLEEVQILYDISLHFF